MLNYLNENELQLVACFIGIWFHGFMFGKWWATVKRKEN
ncbi:hypothetical protein UFOVP1082_9 [uncultured Caudovirales phage]|uniref:Uncharacterized protein n=1 Tax=uncultured Caudovirales phage TaxID=2100421 RepID=A0A6J5PYK4_9CAUD|nr:hypothetical protein UFOVP906_46 [uncultured Caudovirales phage]CAB4176242.1 hypothetical protein UFOVP992_13 [uncultured Caudovirales phage]CAB4182969.1 hypothetical protein UFOVP1082_9 [uncultured Caudovirales phage]CAB4197988.1 hypothetical protein UFOVP1322_53 [uncultured Caudovirales phage]CAB4212389.1 hypothetical protein UFOVP1434_16 [uncultured Caudovirales phage]